MTITMTMTRSWPRGDHEMTTIVSHHGYMVIMTMKWSWHNHGCETTVTLRWLWDDHDHKVMVMTITVGNKPYRIRTFPTFVQSCSFLLTKRHSGKGSAVGWWPEWVGGCLICEAGIGWGDAWTPHDQRADWVKGHINSNTAVAGRQCVLSLVKFGASFEYKKAQLVTIKKTSLEQARCVLVPQCYAWPWDDYDDFGHELTMRWSWDDHDHVRTMTVTMSMIWSWPWEDCDHRMTMT